MQSGTKIFKIVADAPSEAIIDGDNLVVLDGYANKLLDTQIIPDVIIGDFDAIKAETIEYFKNLGVKIIHDTCQNSTDLDKAIKYCDSQNATEIHIYNALGGRLDHTLYNTRILKKYFKHGRRIKLFNCDEVVEFYKDCAIELMGEVGQSIAIMSAPEAIVTSEGLKYDMNGLKLEFGSTESSCNLMAKNRAKLKISGQILLIYSQKAGIK
jgi:thiamine pyrophosphokinase